MQGGARLLVLVLYSDTNESYKNMLEIQRNYLRKIPDIEYYFYCFRETQIHNIEWDGDMIYVKGKETLVPGCLVKTLCAMAVTDHKPYDYLLRPNISTLVDFRKLRQMIASYPTVQYAGPTLTLGWLDEACGITQSVLHKIGGTTYVRGIAILFSKRVVMEMMKYILSIPLHIVDDVAFGVWCKKQGIPLTDWNSFLIENPTTIDITGPHFIYRNKNTDRQNDENTMRNIASTLLK